MKYTFIVMTMTLALAGAVSVQSAEAQMIDAGTAASVKANLGVGQVINASTTVDADVNVNASATGTMKRNENAQGSSSSASATSSTSASSSDSSGSTTSSASLVSVEARQIRGWTEEEKSDFLVTVKSHAELKSEQDLENFAKGVIVSDENVTTIDANTENVEVSYKLPAKFLGIFGAEIDALANVSFDQETSGNGPKEVTVKFPWYKMFFSLDSDVRADVIEGAIESSISTDASTTGTTSVNVSARNGKVIQVISDILKGIRAEITSSVEVDA